jgi:hypothetical protein
MPLVVTQLFYSGAMGRLRELLWIKTSSAKKDVPTSMPHSDYEVKLGDPEPTATARMVIFKLSPKSGSGPRFEGRWDDKQEELDIDVFDVSDKEAREFKAGANGYCGHHNGKAKFPSSGRTYEVKIDWPAIGTVFEGEAIFEIHRVLPAEKGRYPIT